MSPRLGLPQWKGETLGSPGGCPFALFCGFYRFSYKLANPEKGALDMTWLLGHQGPARGEHRGRG